MVGASNPARLRSPHIPIIRSPSTVTPSAIGISSSLRPQSSGMQGTRTGYSMVSTVYNASGCLKCCTPLTQQLRLWSLDATCGARLRVAKELSAAVHGNCCSQELRMMTATLLPHVQCSMLSVAIDYCTSSTTTLRTSRSKRKISTAS